MFVFISAHLSFKHHIFRSLLTLDKYRYQARKWNIVKFYFLIPKHLIIQLVKYQIDILNLKATFWHRKKKIRLLLNKGVYGYSLQNQHYNDYNSTTRRVISFSQTHTFSYILYSRVSTYNSNVGRGICPKLWYNTFGATALVLNHCQVKIFQCYSKRVWADDEINM